MIDEIATDVAYMSDAISKIARYMMIAEEASEVLKEAAKLARIYEGTNPTPRTEEEVRANLEEEMNDLYLSYWTATGHEFQPNYDELRFKADRCVSRLEEANAKE